MGTRHIIAVKADGDYKVAQYGQWDGYPSGQGVDVLRYLWDMDLDVLRNACLKCSFLSQNDIDRYGDDILALKPYLSRDTSADILNEIYKSNGLKLINEIDFVNDSLFCEWAYVIDFDLGTFEVYSGFNQEKLTNCRFNSPESISGQYHPVKLVSKFDLTDLPEIDDFISFFVSDEDE